MAAKSKPQWFGAAVTAVTGGAAELPATPYPDDLQAVVDSYVSHAHSSKPFVCIA